MEGFLGFLSDLLLLTAGLVVLILWIVLLLIVAIEAYDFFWKDRKKSDADDEVELPDIY